VRRTQVIKHATHGTGRLRRNMTRSRVKDRKAVVTVKRVLTTEKQ